MEFPGKEKQIWFAIAFLCRILNLLGYVILPYLPPTFEYNPLNTPPFSQCRLKTKCIRQLWTEYHMNPPFTHFARNILNQCDAYFILVDSLFTWECQITELEIVWAVLHLLHLKMLRTYLVFKGKIIAEETSQHRGLGWSLTKQTTIWLNTIILNVLFTNVQNI